MSVKDEIDVTEKWEGEKLLKIKKKDNGIESMLKKSNVSLAATAASQCQCRRRNSVGGGLLAEDITLRL